MCVKAMGKLANATSHSNIVSPLNEFDTFIREQDMLIVHM